MTSSASWNRRVRGCFERLSGGSGTVVLDGFLTVWYTLKFTVLTYSSPSTSYALMQPTRSSSASSETKSASGMSSKGNICFLSFLTENLTLPLSSPMTHSPMKASLADLLHSARLPLSKKSGLTILWRGMRSPQLVARGLAARHSGVEVLRGRIGGHLAHDVAAVGADRLGR